LELITRRWYHRPPRQARLLPVQHAPACWSPGYGPLGDGQQVEVLWWRRENWGSVGPFGAVFDLNEALAFIVDKPAFRIRAFSSNQQTVRYLTECQLRYR
jgi:hypothetical protein